MQSGEHLEDTASDQRGPWLHLSHLMGKLLSVHRTLVRCCCCRLGSKSDQIANVSDSNASQHLLKPPMEMDTPLSLPDTDFTSNSTGRLQIITNQHSDNPQFITRHTSCKAKPLAFQVWVMAGSQKWVSHQMGKSTDSGHAHRPSLYHHLLRGTEAAQKSHVIACVRTAVYRHWRTCILLQLAFVSPPLLSRYLLKSH